MIRCPDCEGPTVQPPALDGVVCRACGKGWSATDLAIRRYERGPGEAQPTHEGGATALAITLACFTPRSAPGESTNQC